MLERVEHDRGVVTYRSPRLAAAGVPHGFTTRLGGISRPPYDTLNLGSLRKGVGDANTSISENFRRVRAALGLHRVPRIELRQVHGCDVVEAPDRPTTPDGAAAADGVWTRRPSQLLVIRTADCAAVLLASGDGRAVMAVHAGWRGMAAGIVQTAAARLVELAGGADGLIAAIGPCISAEHFEVGEEVAAAFDDVLVHRDSHGTAADARPHVDLRAAAIAQLHAAGVKAIDTTDRCTYRDEAEFYSHRRDVTHRGQPDTGRMAAVIAT